MQKVHIQNSLAKIDTYWSPVILSELNGQHVKAAKLLGTFHWHKHEHEDELFYVVKGSLQIELRDTTITIHPGEFLVVPKGVEHRPIAEHEVHILLFEPVSTTKNGD